MKKISRRRRETRVRRLRRRTRAPQLSFRTFTTARISENASTNADFVDFNETSISIADGVSRSFRPKEWARYLAQKANGSTVEVFRDNLETICANFPTPDFDNLPFTQRGLYDRYGSQSTLMTVHLSPSSGGSVDVTAWSIGDCFLICTAPNISPELMTTWPFSHPDEFPQAPSVICTQTPYVRGIEYGPVVMTINSGERLLVMTDALGRYASRCLKGGLQVNQIFPFLDESVEFGQWARDSVEEGVIEEDDFTIAEVAVK